MVGECYPWGSPDLWWWHTHTHTQAHGGTCAHTQTHAQMQTHTHTCTHGQWYPLKRRQLCYYSDP